MAHPTQPTPDNLCGIPYEIWDHIIDYLELADVLNLRRSGSRFLKAVYEDHHTFCRDIDHTMRVPFNLELLRHRLEAATARTTRTVRLVIDLSLHYRYIFPMKANGGPYDSPQNVATACSAYVSKVIATILPFHGILDLLEIDCCWEHFPLLVPILAQPVPMLEKLRLRISNYEDSQMMLQLPSSLFQGKAPLLNTVTLGCIMPPATPLVMFPSVRTFEADANHYDGHLPVPVGFQFMFPCVETLLLGGSGWSARHCSVRTVGYLTSSRSLKHLQLDFEQEDDISKLLQHLPTSHLESVFIKAYSYDSFRTFPQQLAGLDGHVSLVVTARDPFYIELEFLSTKQPNWQEHLREVVDDFDAIFRMLRDAAQVSGVSITELRIDVAAGGSIISKFSAELPEVTKLALVILPEYEDCAWLEKTYAAGQELMQGSHVAPLPADNDLATICSVELTRDIKSGTAVQTLFQRDANTLVSLLQKMRPNTLFEIDEGISLSSEQHSALRTASHAKPTST